MKFPILDFPGAPAWPAIPGPVTVSAFAVSLAVRTFFFVRHALDGRVGQVGGGCFTGTGTVAIRATSVTTTIVTDTTLRHAERAVLRIVSSLTLLVTCTGSQSGGRCECYEIASFHVFSRSFLIHPPFRPELGRELNIAIMIDSKHISHWIPTYVY